MATQTTTTRKASARKAAATRSVGAAKAAARKAAKAATSAAKAEAKQGAGMLQDYWDAGVDAYNTAEAEARRQINLLVKSKRLRESDAVKALANIRTRFDQERKKAAKTVKTLEARVKKERKAIGTMVDDAVKGTLATLNIPSRQEVAELTRRAIAAQLYCAENS